MSKTKKEKALSPKRQVKKQESGLMDEQLYLFADAYYYATGSDKRYKYAAIKAGVAEGSAATIGMEWARLPQVREYWKSLDESTGMLRRSAYIRALERQEELALDPDIEKIKKIDINNDIMKATESAFESQGEVETEGNKEDSLTLQTAMEIMRSMQLAFGGEDND